jgi:hypothetical protein
MLMPPNVRRILAQDPYGEGLDRSLAIDDFIIAVL